MNNDDLLDSVLAMLIISAAPNVVGSCLRYLLPKSLLPCIYIFLPFQQCTGRALMDSRSKRRRLAPFEKLSFSISEIIATIMLYEFDTQLYETVFKIEGHFLRLNSLTEWPRAVLSVSDDRFFQIFISFSMKDLYFSSGASWDRYVNNNDSSLTP